MSKVAFNPVLHLVHTYVLFSSNMPVPNSLACLVHFFTPCWTVYHSGFVGFWRSDYYTIKSSVSVCFHLKFSLKDGGVLPEIWQWYFHYHSYFYSYLLLYLYKYKCSSSLLFFQIWHNTFLIISANYPLSKVLKLEGSFDEMRE